MMEEFERVVGFRYLKAIHLNDSKGNTMYWNNKRLSLWFIGYEGKEHHRQNTIGCVSAGYGILKAIKNYFLGSRRGVKFMEVIDKEEVLVLG